MECFVLQDEFIGQIFYYLFPKVKSDDNQTRKIYDINEDGIQTKLYMSINLWHKIIFI